MSSIVERSGVPARARTGWRWQAGLWLALVFGAVAQLAAQPVNDNFTNSTVIGGSFGRVTGANTNATIEPGEPFHFSIYHSRSVWFRWTAPASGRVTFNTIGSDFDTIMAAYTGTNLATLVPIAKDDDSGGGFIGTTSLISFPAVGGTEYRIAVDQYGPAFFGLGGNYVLNWSQGSCSNSPALPTEVVFACSDFVIGENNGAMTVTLLAGGGFALPSTVDYFTSDGTAQAGSDYQSVSGTLTFNPGDTLKTFTIPILDNTIQNSNKTIYLTLTNATGDAIIGPASNSVVTIVDDETPPFMSPAGEFNIVWPQDSFGFLDPPIQYTPIPATITLPFNPLDPFGFLFSSLPQYVVTENETTSANTIGGSIPTINDYPARSVRGALITVKRSAPAVGRVMVDYFTTNLFVPNVTFTNLNISNSPIASPLTDYIPVAGTLVFDDYQMSANFVVPILQNSFNTNAAFFNVVIANARPAPEEDAALVVPTIGITNFATVEILKINAATRGVSLERVTYRADEYRSFPQGTTNVVTTTTNFLDVDVICPNSANGYSATITIFVNRYIFPLQVGSDYTDPVGIFFDNSLYTDGTGLITNTPDYNPAALSVTFTATQHRDSVRIPIVGDRTVEFNEDILVFVSATSPNGNFGPNRFANVTIVYDDQPAGAADREWNPEGVVYTNPRFYNTPGANNNVSAVVVQPDQKTLLAGDFDHVNSFTRNHVARFNFDGALDQTFGSGTGADGSINAMALYPATAGTNAGKILIGGSFSSFGGTSRYGLARLNANGTLDNSFTPGNGANGIVRAVALQNDGKVIVAGDFTTFSDLNVNGIMRVNPNGSLDSSFDPGLGANGSIWALRIDESAGAGARVIYVGGEFTSFGGVPRSRLTRLTDSGAVDTGYDPGLGADGAIYALALQADGKLIIAGAFDQYHIFARSSIARINADGTLDENYNIGIGFNDSVYSLRLQPDGKVLVGGIFTSFNTTRRMGLARLFTSGSLDTSFMDTAYNQFAGLPKTFSYDNPSFINSIDLQTNGDLMIGGSFTNVGGNLSVNYPLYPSIFDPISGRTNLHNNGGHPSAPFTRQDKTTRFNIARLIGGYTLGPGNLEYDPGSQPFVIDENSGNLAVTLRRVDGRLGTAQVIPSTTNNTALFPLDFSSSTSTQTWFEYDATINAVFVLSPVSVGFVGNNYFNVPITDDSLLEGDETFGLILSNAFGGITLGGEFIPMGAGIGHNDLSSATVADNDFTHGMFNFLTGNYTVNENAGTATITVIRTNGTSGAADIRYLTRNGTATNGGDYTSVSGTLHFFQGQTNATFTIPILNGPEVEFDETVTLILTNASGATLPGGSGISSGTLTVTATLTIVDDDFLPGRLQFAAANFTNNENDVNAVVTVTRTGGTVGAMTVQYQTLAGGTATAGSDYTPTNGTLTWADGDNSPRTFTVPLASDGLVEVPESVLLRLSNPGIFGALGARTNATLWINDGDSYGALSFNQSFYETDENGSAPTITVIRSGGSAGTVSVQFATSPIIATPNTDYRDTNGTLTFLPGEFSKTFTVPVIDNTDPDGDKTVQIALSSPVNATLGAFTNVVLNIVDNESINTPAGSLDTTFSAVASANAAVYALALQLDGRLVMAGDFTQVSSVPRNRLARLKPNGLLDTSFDIGPGADAPIRALALTGDGKLLVGGLFTTINSTNRARLARLYPDGKVDISFNPGSGADNPVFALAVQPNEKVLVGGSFNTFNNVTRPGLVRLNTNGVVDTTFNIGAGFNGIIYAIAVQNNGKVLVGGDFISFNGQARTNLVRLNANGSLDNTFNPGLYVSAPVRAILVEPTAQIVFGGSFTNVNGQTRNFLARVDQNGVLDPNFLSTPASPGADNTVYAIRQQVDGRLMVAGDFRFFNNVTRNGVTRLYDADGATDPTINFGNGANAFVAALVIQPDRRMVLGGGFTEYDDQPRQYVCRIYGGSIAGSGSLEFSRSQFVVSESATNAVITVRRRGGTAGTVRADAYTQDGTALANIDYLRTSNTLVFPLGETRQIINVPILSNDTLNGDRQAGLLLGSFVNAIPGPQPVAALVIQDDEVSIGFSTANYAINENAVSGNATITLLRMGGTNTAASITIATVPGGTATAGADYLATNGVVSFAPGEASKQFNVRILNDPALEGNESILLALSNPSGTTSLGITNAVLNVIDDDTAAGQFLFATNNFAVDESSGSVTVTVLRTNGSLGIVSVRLTTSNLTALAFSDYVPTNRVLNFADGETAKSVVLPILNDTNVEPTETFLLTLSQPSALTSLLQTNSLVTIFDDEVVTSYVGFLTNNFFVTESNGLAVISVVRTNGRRGQLSVDFSISNGSATSGQDYVLTNGTLVFLDGQDVLNFVVPILDDNLGEGDETVRLSLTNLQGTNNPVLTLPTSTLTIVDDDATLRFSSGTYTTNENAGAAVITVLRVGVTNLPVGVTYSTTPGGTAVAGLDYIPVTGSLNWAAGDTTAKTFLVPLIDNNILNQPKTVSLILTNPVGLSVYVTSPTNAVLTITDNETVAPIAGPVDPLFNAGFGANATVFAIVYDAQERLYVGGSFTQLFGLNINRVARLSPNGAVDFGFDPGVGADAPVYALARSTNGVYVGGAFTNLNGVAHQGITRLNPDGSVDLAFNPGTGANGPVFATASASGNQVVMGGQFTSINGVPAARIARLGANGALDASFNPGSGANAAVRAVAVQTNGQILIGGEFSTVNGFLLTRLARLNVNGVVDTSFGNGLGADGTVNGITLQPDGKIIVVGDFQTINGAPRAGVARLNSDGSVDFTFDPGDGANGSVRAAGVESDGHILVVGDFLTFDGNPTPGVARLNANGSIDSGFIVGAGADAPVRTIGLVTRCVPPAVTVMNFNGLASDSAAYVNYTENCLNIRGVTGGHFHAVTNGALGTAAEIFGIDGVPQEITLGGFTFSLRSINFTNVSGPVTVTSSSGGSVQVPAAGVFTFDSAFANVVWVRINVGPVDVATVDDVTVIPGPDALTPPTFAIGGDFQKFNNVLRGRVAVLTSGGTAYPVFDPRNIAARSVYALGLNTNAALPALIGRLMVGGDFNTIVGVNQQNGVARLNLDGTLDRGFRSGVGFDAAVRGLAVQPDGRVIVGGLFTNYDLIPRSYFARLNANGTVDNTFNFANNGANLNNPVLALALQPDGRTVIGGSFTTVYGAPRNSIARMNTNGTVDVTFAPGLGANGPVHAVALQSDGKVIVGGDFTMFNGVARARIARLNTNGTLDVTFDPGTGADGAVNAVAVTAGGQILLGGVFANVNGSAAPRVARLTGTGAVDGAFNPGTGANDFVSSITVQTDGRALVGGNFTTFNGQIRNRLVRLNSDGSHDPTINFGAGANDFISAITLQDYDGKIIVGGGFTEFDGQTRVAIARLLGGTNSGTGSFRFSAAAYVVNERGSNAVLLVQRVGGTLGAASVAFSTGNGTASAPVDYTATSGTLNFANAESVKQITVPILDNSIVNGDRSFNVSLSSPGAGTSLSAPSNAVVTIQDNDSVISFASSAYLVNESAAVARITVTRSGGAVDTVSVEFTTGLGGTATPGVDFTPIAGTLTFAPGVRTRTFDVTVLDDTINEFNETVSLLLANPVGAVTFGLSNATLTIVENDFGAGVIGFSTNSYFGSEDAIGGISVELFRTNGHSGGVTVNYQTLTGSATPGVDYLATNGVVTFADGQTNAFITIYPLDDLLTEGNETVLLQLSASSGAATLGRSASTLTIVDNDAPGSFVFSSPVYSVSEAGTFATIAIVRTNGNVGGVSVTVQTSGGSATPTLDYTPVSNVLNFAAGQSVRTITIPILDDLTPEGTETVGLLLSNPTGGTSIGVPGTATLFILDNEASVGFTAPSFSITESTTNVSVTLIRIGDTNAAFSVTFNTSDGSAAAGADYTATTVTVAFAPGETNKTVGVGVFDDTLAEGNETVNLTLSSPSSGVTLGPIGTAVLTILDNDTAYNFSSATYATNEGTLDFTIVVYRSGFAGSASSVSFATADGTATVAGLDYLSATGVLAFAVGQTSAAFNVRIQDDSLVENNETINLLLFNPSIGTFLGAQATAVITILDNDTSVGFAQTNFVVNEKATNAAITLVRNGAATQPVSVGFRTQNGTAAAGVDYSFTTQLVAWAANDIAPKTVLVPVTDDAVTEGSETVLLILSNPTGAVIDPAAASAVLTIVDNAGTIAFASATASAVEGAGFASINLARTGGTNGTVSVQWSVTGGSATAGQDYSTAAGTVVFANGETIKPILFPITDDSLIEGIETVTFSLANATGGGRVGTPSTATLSILDDDTGIIVAAGAALIAESFSPTNNVIEPGETVTLLFALRNSGLVNAGNVTASLVYATGVSNTAPQSQSYGALLAGGNSVSRPFSFIGIGTNGTRITATLLITNNGLFLGPVSFDFVLGSQSVPFQNAGAITIPANGQASPYPSTITVSGVAGLVTKLTVSLNNLNHTYPDDLDILLVGPNGAAVMLMSDAGGGNALTGVNLTFDDAAASTLPDSTAITSGTYRAVNYAPLADTIPPFTAGTVWSNTSLASYNGINPNGVWSLYVFDDNTTDGGSILVGWSLNVSTMDVVVPGVDLGVSITDAPDPVDLGGTITYTVGVVNYGPATATSVVLTNVLPAEVTFVSVSGPGSSPPLIGNVLVRNIGTLAAGAGVTVTVTVTAPNAGALLTCDATVASAMTDANPGNNFASIKTTVSGPGPLPLLLVARKNGLLALSWQSTATNVVLQSGSALSAGAWGNAPGVPVISNGFSTVTVPIDTGLKFYRLKLVP